MRILIVGGGAVGSNLAEQLAAEKHDVSLIDSREEVAKALGGKLDAQVLHGNGGSPQVLEEAGIREAEMTIAVTDSDELNMIVSLLARNYGVKTRIARIRNPEYSGPSSKLGREQLAIDHIINPEVIAIETMEKLIFTAGATEVADFAGQKVLLMGFLVPKDAPIAGRTLQAISEIVPDQFLIVAIHRGAEVIIPRGGDRIEEDDRIYVLMPQEILPLFQAQLYRRVEKVRKVVIFGATRLGIGLAERLEGRLGDVALVDPDAARCNNAAERLNKTTVLHGSALDPDLLAEIRIGNAQVYCALTEDDAANVMSALLAKDHGATKTIVNLAEPDFVPIAERIGLDAAINPRLLAVNVILRYVRSGRILSVFHLEELKAEAVELVPSARAPLVGVPLSQLAGRIPQGALVGAVMRDGQMLIPRGDTVIAPNERVIVFATEKALPDVQRLFVEDA